MSFRLGVGVSVQVGQHLLHSASLHWSKCGRQAAVSSWFSCSRNPWDSWICGGTGGRSGHPGLGWDTERQNWSGGVQLSPVWNHSSAFSLCGVTWYFTRFFMLIQVMTCIRSRSFARSFVLVLLLWQESFPENLGTGESSESSGVFTTLCLATSLKEFRYPLETCNFVVCSCLLNCWYMDKDRVI